jgi:hypothetical protein
LKGSLSVVTVNTELDCVQTDALAASMVASGAADVWCVIFHWNTELELTRRQIADLEVKISELRDELQGANERPTAVPIDRILDGKARILAVRLASLDRAKFHARFVEHKIATGAKGVKALPYAELALVCT